MKKINFENNATKGNAQTFNTLQDNVEEAINDIVTSDINDNDGYIKFNNGTLICWGVNTGINDSYREFYFPQQFISRPTLTANTSITDINYMAYAQILDFDTQKAKVAIYWRQRTSQDGTFAIGGNHFWWIAIGRWK